MNSVCPLAITVDKPPLAGEADRRCSDQRDRCVGVMDEQRPTTDNASPTDRCVVHKVGTNEGRTTENSRRAGCDALHCANAHNDVRWSKANSQIPGEHCAAEKVMEIR